MRWKPAFVVAVTLACPCLAGAQVVDPGMTWSGSSGSFAGSPCGGFTCTPHAVSVSVNEIVTLTVRGTLLTHYAIGMSSTATQCLAIPGVQHALILDFPITLPVTGVFVDGDPALLCPGGRAVFTFAFPFLPPGTTFSIQAIGEVPNLAPSLTSAITVTVL